jgi:peptidoglycan hydrolase-like protein with peptidoglycan-binding domain
VGTDFGPCRAADLNWASPRTHTNSNPCRDYPPVAPAVHASAVKLALVTYSGAVVRPGSRGPAVSAVQRALRVNPGGSFATATRNAVAAFQGRHGLMRTGSVGASTGRALLAAVR